MNTDVEEPCAFLYHDVIINLELTRKKNDLLNELKVLYLSFNQFCIAFL